MMGLSVEAMLAALREDVQRVSEAVRMPRLPTLLRYKDAAHELATSVTGIKTMVRNSELLTVKVGKRKRIPAEEIIRYKQEHLEAATPRVRPRRQVQRYDAKAEAQAIRDAIRAERKKRR